jgi:uncharacterized membrane protein
MFLAAWLYFGGFSACAIFTGVTFIIKIFLYVIHEYLWARFEKVELADGYYE